MIFRGKGDKAPKSPYLAGKLLLAMPSMGDPRFHKAVIFMCAHDESGAMGLVLNHVLPGINLSQLLSQLNIAEGSPPRSVPVMSGGPVETARGFVLHTSDFLQSDTVRVTDELCVTGTIDALKAIAAGKGPEKMLFILGYAGWGPAQLDREMQDNAWLVAEPTGGLIFGAEPEDMWGNAVKGLGVDPAMLSGAAGHA